LKGSDLSPEEIDSVVHGHYEDVASQIDCQKCGNCCKTVRIILGKSDISRLANHLKKPVKDFVQEYLAIDEETKEHCFRAMPCPFLRGKSCAVYDLRPAGCRSYPHLHTEGFVFKLYQALSNCSVCPIVFNVMERLRREKWTTTR